MKPEKVFSSELTASFKQFCASHQIYYHLIQNDAFTTTTKFTHKKDFDGLAWATGDFGASEYEVKVLAMEYKAVNAKDRFYLREIKEHQFAGLRKAVNGGAESLILVNFRGLEGKQKTRAFWIPTIQIFIWQEEDKKAVTIDMISPAWELNRIKLDAGTYGWDVRDLWGDHPYEKKEVE